jgi:hypothetical protein
VLELAVVAGATLGDRGVSPRLREYAAGLTNGSPFPDAEAFFSPSVPENLATFGTDPANSEGVRSSVD